MRAYQWLAVAALAAAYAAPARAQNVPFGFPTNNQIVFNVINPATNPNTIAPPMMTSNPSRLQNFLHWFTPWNNSPVIGQSNFPAPGNIPGGPAYLQAFGFKMGGQ